ncbi:MAG: hypothetical protein Q8L98_07160 [Chlamydiales bacterium]|nr:hypothetical protein [Chlamydiales bacterium]
MTPSTSSFSSSITGVLSSISINTEQHNDPVSNIYSNYKPSVDSPFSSVKPRTWVELEQWHQSLRNFLNQDKAIQPPRRYSGIPYGEILNPHVEHEILFADEEILKIEQLTFAKYSPLAPDYSKVVTDVFKLVFQGNSANGKKSVCRNIEYGLFALAKTFDDRHVIFQSGLEASCAAMLIMDLGKTPDLKALNCLLLGDDLESYIKRSELIPVKTELSTDDVMGKIREIQKLIHKNGPGIFMISTYHYPFIIDQIVIDRHSEAEGAVDIRDPHHGWAITVTLKALKDLIEDFYPDRMTFLQMERAVSFLAQEAR